VVGEHRDRRVEARLGKRERLRAGLYAGAASGGRWAIITDEGSTAITSRSRGS